MSHNPKGRYQDSEKYRKALNAAFERERYQFLANAKGKAFALEGAPTSHFEAINISVPKPRDDKGRLLLIAAAALVLVAVFGFVANAMPVVLLAVAALLASLGYWMCINSKQGEAGRARPVSGPGNPAISVDAPPAAEHRPQIGLRVTLPSGELHTCTLSLPATIGRNRQLGDLTLNDPAISRYHLRVELREGQMYARDLGSYNGSELNGRALVGEVPLQAADRLTLGATSLEVL